MKYGSLANSYLAVFCMEMGMLIQSGISLDDGILMLQDDEKEKDGKAVLQTLLDNLSGGEALSMALQKSGHFPKYMISMIEIGENTGRLVETLEALSEHYERRERLSAAIKNAVFYPAILLAMMIAVVLILIIKVLPIFNDVFSRLGGRMSPLAVNLMHFGVWLGDASVIIAALACVVALAVFVIWMIVPARKAVSNAFRNFFGGRGIWGKIASSRFISALALSTASGLNTEEAVSMAASVSGGAKTVDEQHKKCLKMISEGNTLSESLFAAGILSARDSRILSLGSRSGMETKAISEIASRSDRSVQENIDSIIGKIEPTLVIITSVLIGIILLSVMLPLMGIMSSIG